MIKLPNTDVETLGFVTRDDLSNLPEGLDHYEDHVVVYVQWSYQMGGYCFIVPRDSVRPVAMTVDQGMLWALTAGVSAPTIGKTHEHGSGEIEESGETPAPDAAGQEEAEDRKDG